MSTHKNIDRICIAFVIIALIVTVLFMNGSRLGIKKIVDMDSESYDGPEYVTANDLNGDWDTSEATFITFDGDDINIEGNGAYEYNNDLVIANSGYYVLSGSSQSCTVTVDSNENSKVWIMLNGIDLYSEDDACIKVAEADKVFLTLASDTVNTLSSGSSYSQEAIDDGCEAVIFSHDDLTINGDGVLSIESEYRHGIKANDDLVIAGGIISITVPEDAIHVNEDVALVNTVLTIDAGDDAVTTEKTINIENADIYVKSCYEGFEASCINVYSGEIELYPSDDGFNARKDSESEDAIMFGQRAKQTVSVTKETDENSDEDTDDSPASINIYDGTITIINKTARDADGLDSNGDINIYGGYVLISLTDSGSNNAIDYGSESGGSCTIDGGTVIACGSSSMAESISSSSKQASVMYRMNSSIEADSKLVFSDSAGNKLIEETIPCSYSCLILSSPDLTVGNEYTLETGSSSESITIDSISTAYGNSQNEGFGNFKKQDGMMQRGTSSGDSTDNTSVTFENRRGFDQGMTGESDGLDMRRDKRFGGGNESNINGTDMPQGTPPGMDGTNRDFGERPDMGDTDRTFEELPDMDDTDKAFEGFPDIDDSDRAFEGLPDMNGMDKSSGSDDTQQHMRKDFRNQSPENTEASETSSSTALSEYSANTWILLSVSVAVLVAGMIFVITYKRR